MDSARTLYVQKQLNMLKEENEFLKSAVHRLNVELSDYQAKYRPVDAGQLKQVISFICVQMFGHVWTHVDMQTNVDVWTSVDMCGKVWTGVDKCGCVDKCRYVWTNVDMWTNVDVWTHVDMC